MKSEKDVFEKEGIKITDERVEIQLQANQYALDQIEQYTFFLKPKRNLLAGDVSHLSTEKLIIQYKKTSQMKCFSQVLIKLDFYQRLLLAQKVNQLCDFMNGPIQPLFHPDNLFLFGEEIFLAHRGFMQVIAPYTVTENDFLKQYRALVLAILYPNLSYESLNGGSEGLTDDLSKLLHGAKNVTEINQIISDQIETQKEIRATELRVVSRKNYFIFKWGSLLFSLSTILFALLTGNYAFYQLPQIERSVDAQAKYIAKDYAGVLTALADVSPSLFSQSIKYIVAVSVIQLDHLTSLEKTAILNQLSQESSENRLLYWIYIDRNNLQ